MLTGFLKRINIESMAIGFGLLLFLGGCQREIKQVAPPVERGSLSWDYSGKLANVINKDTLSHNDSLNILSYLYQAAAMDSRLYELQSKLTTAYFWGCHDQCLKNRCTSGDIAAAAVDYLLKGQTDSALFAISWIDREIVAKAPEFREIGNITGFIADKKFENDWLRPYKDGLIKTPAGIALWAVTSINVGANPKPWIAALTTVLTTSDAASLKYAIAYAIMKAGKPLIAWQTMPVYIPETNRLAPPDFEQELIQRDTSNVSTIFLNLNQYVISKVEQAFLHSIIDSYYSLPMDSLEKVITLASFKGIYLEIIFDRKFTMTDYIDQIIKATSMENHSGYSPETGLSKLANPLARAMFLYIEASSEKADKAFIRELVFSEIDAVKSTNDWESKILLTLALENIMAPSEVLSRISPFIAQDTLLTDYSPEWLALYATYCIGDNTKSERLARIGKEFNKAYPYAPGIKELIDKINRMCNR